MDFVLLCAQDVEDDDSGRRVPSSAKLQPPFINLGDLKSFGYHQAVEKKNKSSYFWLLYYLYSWFIDWHRHTSAVQRQLACPFSTAWLSQSLHVESVTQTQHGGSPPLAEQTRCIYALRQMMPRRKTMQSLFTFTFSSVDRMIWPDGMAFCKTSRFHISLECSMPSVQSSLL